MLAIRMQRTGRKGHAMFRVVVQDSRRTPTSGKVVAQIGSYDPHAKTTTLKKDKAAFYLEHGAQPSERVVKLFVSEGVTLPAWVKQPATDKQRVIRTLDKLRRNKPQEKVAEVVAAPAAEEAATEQIETAAQPETEVQAVPAEAPEAAAEAGTPAATAETAEPAADTTDGEKTEA